jgi:hypothetical protein
MTAVQQLIEWGMEEIGEVLKLKKYAYISPRN